jgi:hypothetical protein
MTAGAAGACQARPTGSGSREPAPFSQETSAGVTAISSCAP